MATIDITLSTYQHTIESNEIVFVDFWAAWCGPCRSFAPIFERASEQHPEILFAKVDTEAEQELAGGFRITSIPTLMAFRDNILVFSQPGALQAPQLQRVIDGVTGLNMDEVRTQIAEYQAANGGDQ